MRKKTAGGRRIIITKNLILMLVLLVVILVAVFAWYTSNSTASSERFSVSAKAADGVELALPVNDKIPTDNSLWSPSLDFKDSGFLQNLVKDTTSNGTQFVIPNFESSTSLAAGRQVRTDDVWSVALSSKDALLNDNVNDDDQYNYISLDFYMRAKSDSISITETSYLASGSELGINDEGQTTTARALKGDTIYRKSSYGAAAGNQNAFSSDAIVGAMRVSMEVAPVTVTKVIENNEPVINESVATMQLRFLWLPRPDVYLQTAKNESQWSLYNDVKPTDTLSSQTYFHKFYLGKTETDTVNQETITINKGLEEKIYYDPSVKTCNDENAESPPYFKVSKVPEGEFNNLGKAGYYPKLGQRLTVADGGTATGDVFTASGEQNDISTTDGYYVYKCRLNIWIEGEDAEARRSMNTGLFSLFLDFGS